MARAVALRDSVVRSRAAGGPYDVDDLDPEATDATGAIDCGSIRVPVPAHGTVSVDPKGRMQSVHIALPEGRLSVSALAAPRSSTLWPELCREIADSLRDGGARVRTFTGYWGRELYAVTGAATSVFVGVDGPRWMVYGVATGPTTSADALDVELRRMLRGTVVARGHSPYPVRTVLPLVLPEHLLPEPDQPVLSEPVLSEPVRPDVTRAAPAVPLATDATRTDASATVALTARPARPGSGTAFFGDAPTAAFTPVVGVSGPSTAPDPDQAVLGPTATVGPGPADPTAAVVPAVAVESVTTAFPMVGPTAAGSEPPTSVLTNVPAVSSVDVPPAPGTPPDLPVEEPTRHAAAATPSREPAMTRVWRPAHAGSAHVSAHRRSDEGPAVQGPVVPGAGAVPAVGRRANRVGAADVTSPFPAVRAVAPFAAGRHAAPYPAVPDPPAPDPGAIGPAAAGPAEPARVTPVEGVPRRGRHARPD